MARQKACNLLCALETVQLLVEARSGKPMASAASAPGAKVLTCQQPTVVPCLSMNCPYVWAVRRCSSRSLCVHTVNQCRCNAACAMGRRRRPWHLSTIDPVHVVPQEAAENRAACQAALLKAGVLDILIGASLGDGAIASLTVRAQARCWMSYPHAC